MSAKAKQSEFTMLKAPCSLIRSHEYSRQECFNSEEDYWNTQKKAGLPHLRRVSFPFQRSAASNASKVECCILQPNVLLLIQCSKLAALWRRQWTARNSH